MTTQQALALAIQISIALTVLGLGLTASLEDATFLLRRPVLLGRAVLSMSIIMPIIAIIIATTVLLPAEVRAALVALSVSPVPPIIQKKQLAAGGREGYVVGLLVAMSVLAIVLVPVTVAIVAALFDKQAGVTAAQVAKIMLTTVLVPLGLGLLLRRLWPASTRAVPAVRVIAGVLLVGGVIALLLGLWPIMRTYLGNGIVLMLAVMAVLGLIVGHLLGGPDAGDRTALALSTSSRHPAVALAIATSGPLGEVKPALAIILLYLVVATIAAIPYQRWRRHATAAAVRLAASGSR